MSTNLESVARSGAIEPIKTLDSILAKRRAHMKTDEKEAEDPIARWRSYEVQRPSVLGREWTNVEAESLDRERNRLAEAHREKD
jgi:hypothetical protein